MHNDDDVNEILEACIKKSKLAGIISKISIVISIVSIIISLHK